MKHLGWKSLVAATLLLVISAVTYANAQTQNQGSKSFDLGEAVLQVEKLDYYHGNEVVPDVFTVDFLLINKAGRNEPFQPEGELTFRGQSGKEFLIPNMHPDKLVPFNFKRLGRQHAEFQELYKRGLVKAHHLRPPGEYTFCLGAEIDKGEKIIALIYRNGDVTKELDISDMGANTHSFPTEEFIEEQKIIEAEKQL